MVHLKNFEFEVKCDEENNPPILVDNKEFSCILSLKISNDIYQKDIAYIFQSYLNQAYNDSFQRNLLKTYVELSLSIFIEDSQ